MDVLQAVAERSRHAILRRLRDEGELSVAELVRRLGIKQDDASYHLARLRDAGLVESVPEGRRRYYRIAPDRVAEVDTWLHALATWPKVYG